MPTSLPDLLAQVRSYCAQYGEMAVEIRITLQSGLKITHPVPAVPAALGPMHAPPSALPRALPPCRHSIDFRSVHWFGRDYSFTPTQAACVKTLWEAWEAGLGEMSQLTVLERAGSDCDRLRPLFQDSPAWGTMIVPGATGGSFRLAVPAEVG